MNKETEFSAIGTLTNVNRNKHGTVNGKLFFYDEAEGHRAWAIFNDANLAVKVTLLDEQLMVDNLNGDTYE